MKKAKHWSQPCPNKDCKDYDQVNKGNISCISSYMTMTNVGTTPIFYPMTNVGTTPIFYPQYRLSFPLYSPSHLTISNPLPSSLFLPYISQQKYGGCPYIFYIFPYIFPRRITLKMGSVPIFPTASNHRRKRQ